MLAMRLQRTGRTGHAQFRFIVQDSHAHPTRGKVVAYLGSYNPHTKQSILDKEKAAQFLSNGAQPSDRVARLFKSEGIKLPDWVKLSDPKERTIRNVEKLRKNRTDEPAAEAPAEEASSEEPEAPATPSSEEAPDETPAEEPAPEAPAAEPEAETPSQPDAPAEQ
jgi:small subunit ribosomal protein S16